MYATLQTLVESSLLALAVAMSLEDRASIGYDRISDPVLSQGVCRFFYHRSSKELTAGSR